MGRNATLERLLQPDPAFERVSGKVYSCLDCGRRLFSENNIIPLHEGRTCGVDNFPIDAVRFLLHTTLAWRDVLVQMSWMKSNAIPVGNDMPLQCVRL